MSKIGSYAIDVGKLAIRMFSLAIWCIETSTPHILLIHMNTHA